MCTAAHRLPIPQRPEHAGCCGFMAVLLRSSPEPSVDHSCSMQDSSSLHVISATGKQLLAELMDVSSARLTSLGSTTRLLTLLLVLSHPGMNSGLHLQMSGCSQLHVALRLRARACVVCVRACEREKERWGERKKDTEI